MAIGVRRLVLPASALAVATALAACSGQPAAPKATKATTVSVSVSTCGQGWSSGKAGEQHFVLRNTDTRSGEVDLVSASNGAVYAEVEPLGAGTHTTLDADLGAGRYAFRCSMEDEPSILGATVRLTGSVRGDTPAVQAVSQGDLIGASKTYEQYVIKRLPALAKLVSRVRSDVSDGDLVDARRDWLPAHLAYQRLGAAYGAFGDIDGDLNGLADGLPDGTSDPAWHGFHRLEFGLWHGQSAAVLRPVADRLVADVASLRKDFPHAQVDPLDIGIRAHEITEDAVRFVLSGRDDYGSGSSLATVRADLDGTREVLAVVRPLIEPRYRGIAQVDAQLRTTAADVDATRGPSRTWPPLDSLSRTARERIDGDVSELAEELAPVAVILEPRRTS